MYGPNFSTPGDLFAHFDRLRDQLDQAFGNSFTPAGIRTARLGAFPPINTGVSPDSIEVVCFAPGLNPSALKVVVDKGLLTIEGERKSDLPEKQDKVTVYA